MAGVKQMFFPLIFQGFYLGSLCQQWTFPSRISALIGSCVEIPCTYHPDGRSGQSSTVWYSYATVSYPEILNTKKKSSVMEEFKDRTSLVPGENSCTLRIDPVIEDDEGEYYPGIAEEKKTNAYDKNSGTLILNVRASPADIYLYMSPAIREGEATTIQCAAYHTCRSSPPSLQWNREGQIKKRSVKISEGSWREESELTYILSYIDDGSIIQCTATYPNGQKTTKSSTMSVIYPPQNVYISIIGSNETIEGIDVTLQCNSNSKPDVRQYEWYKGKNKTRLPDIGRMITIRNVTRDVEPYSCAAINHMGRGESALTEILVLYERSSPSFMASNGSIILLAIIGAVCPLILVFLVYFIWRKRCRKVTSSEPSESPDTTYCDLMKKDIESEYEDLKPKILEGQHQGAADLYQNTHKQI